MIQMKKFGITILTCILCFMTKANATYDKVFFDFKIVSINGENIDLSKYKNKAILIVNVASRCGFTKQYDDLEKLWNNYKDKGLIVIGFPSNQFGGQEPGTDSEIKNFCESNFNITFPLSTKIDVKGNNIDPIYKWALDNHGKSTIPKWNFYKILINKEGKIHNTYSSITNPMSNKIKTDIENILN